jgi:hypothetical protein
MQMESGLSLTEVGLTPDSISHPFVPSIQVTPYGRDRRVTMRDLYKQIFRRLTLKAKTSAIRFLLIQLLGLYEAGVFRLAVHNNLVQG